MDLAKPRAHHAAGTRRHIWKFNVIASEAKQSISPRKKEEWIASSLRSSQ
jgi:hypothetical protein